MPPSRRAATETYDTLGRITSRIPARTSRSWHPTADGSGSRGCLRPRGRKFSRHSGLPYHPLTRRSSTCAGGDVLRDLCALSHHFTTEPSRCRTTHRIDQDRYPRNRQAHPVHSAFAGWVPVEPEHKRSESDADYLDANPSPRHAGSSHPCGRQRVRGRDADERRRQGGCQPMHLPFGTDCKPGSPSWLPAYRSWSVANPTGRPRSLWSPTASSSSGRPASPAHRPGNLRIARGQPNISSSSMPTALQLDNERIPRHDVSGVTIRTRIRLWLSCDGIGSTASRDVGSPHRAA